MLETLSRTFTEAYKPSRCQSIDEFKIRFQGRCSFRQYTAKKFIKCGYDQINVVLCHCSRYIQVGLFFAPCEMLTNYFSKRKQLTKLKTA